MAKAIRIHETGGPDVLKWEDVQTPAPGPGEVLIAQNAVGLNFIDVYFRTGLYPAQPPFTPGGEGAGVVAAVGEGVQELKEGDRVAYATNGGAYAQERLMPADRVVKIPDGVSDEQAAAIMLKGMTAWYLLRRTFPVKAGDRILYHAAAGGVGLILGQWAKHLGAQAIGTAGGEEKVKLALQHGYNSVIDYKTDDFVSAVAKLTDGEKCDVVYDSVGKDTFEGSLDCLRPLGMFVSFGQSSGQVPPFSINLLAQKGSIFTTRPTLFTYIAKRKELEAAAEELFGLVVDGVITPKVNQRYPLSNAGQAHEDLENRRTSGATVLIP
ncbi:quinone oxidoreductase family protein [Nitratireductor basaltis]|uniref:Alcohol dehydrogenase, zinc-binding protein n=1 Tax=Nitratireductor basaltis TaxID=472175 RepID=A0A084UAN2_9HYPH|nr:quinone oxidoreductase [Nitratireductor basaltis]KFB10018.1 Alcohol dehydrogenase, zinc-binding protein [Nitratireductor basaltis]